MFLPLLEDLYYLKASSTDSCFCFPSTHSQLPARKLQEQCQMFLSLLENSILSERVRRYYMLRDNFLCMLCIHILYCTAHTCYKTPVFLPFYFPSTHTLLATPAKKDTGSIPMIFVCGKTHIIKNPIAKITYCVEDFLWHTCMHLLSKPDAQDICCIVHVLYLLCSCSYLPTRKECNR
jgi:hypothetical protein